MAFSGRVFAVYMNRTLKRYAMKKITGCIALIGMHLLSMAASPYCNSQRQKIDKDSLIKLVVGPEEFRSSEDHNSAELLPTNAHISTGFSDKTTSYQIEVTTDVMLTEVRITSDADRSFQYTMSDVDGRILAKQFFRHNHTLQIGHLPAGQYALYFFAGKKVVRAVLIDKDAPRLQIVKQT